MQFIVLYILMLHMKTFNGSQETYVFNSLVFNAVYRIVYFNVAHENF